MRNRLTVLIILLMVCGGINVWAEPANQLFQFSTLHAISNGYAEGDMTVKDLLIHGNFGLGTFNKMDGEMVLLDGVIYQVQYSGKVSTAPDQWKTPFACVTFFKPQGQFQLPPLMDYHGFRNFFDSILPSLNWFYAIKIEGKFNKLTVRSVPKQTAPYPALSEVVKHQSIFDVENEEGTIIGFRCPLWIEGLNVAGYHLHFLSKDKTKGGHVLAFATEKVTCEYMSLHELDIVIPKEGEFCKAKLENTPAKSCESSH